MDDLVLGDVEPTGQIEMKYYFTGFQINTEGEEIPFNNFTYSTVDEAFDRYLTEMRYAFDAVGILNGCTVIIYDSLGNILRDERWVRGTLTPPNV